jgi:hypothetical protein
MSDQERNEAAVEQAESDADVGSESLPDPDRDGPTPDAEKEEPDATSQDEGGDISDLDRDPE